MIVTQKYVFLVLSLILLPVIYVTLDVEYGGDVRKVYSNLDVARALSFEAPMGWFLASIKFSNIYISPAICFTGLYFSTYLLISEGKNDIKNSNLAFFSLALFLLMFSWPIITLHANIIRQGYLLIVINLVLLLIKRGHPFLSLLLFLPASLIHKSSFLIFLVVIFSGILYYFLTSHMVKRKKIFVYLCFVGYTGAYFVSKIPFIKNLFFLFETPMPANGQDIVSVLIIFYPILVINTILGKLITFLDYYIHVTFWLIALLYFMGLVWQSERLFINIFLILIINILRKYKMKHTLLLSTAATFWTVTHLFFSW